MKTVLNGWKHKKSIKLCNVSPNDNTNPYSIKKYQFVINAIKMTSYTTNSFWKAIKWAIKRLSLIGLFLLHFPFFKIWYFVLWHDSITLFLNYYVSYDTHSITVHIIEYS